MKNLIVVADIDTVIIPLKEEIRKMNPGEKISFEVTRNNHGEEWAVYKVTDESPNPKAQ